MSSTSRRWLLGAIVAVIAIASVVLTLLALDHVRPRPTGDDVAPVPSFTQPATSTPSPTPSETSATVVSYDRSQERFLAVSASVLWRGTAGQCGTVEPLLERSADGGETWTDVTPRYLGIGQIMALNPFADGQAEIIAAMGADCEVQALRTFTQGQFWESYPEALAASRYADPVDAANIVAPSGPIAAPCSDARSFRAAGTTLATVCDGTAYVLDAGAEWLQLPLTNVAALNFDGSDVVVAYVTEQCDGLTLSRVASAGGAFEEAGCAEVSGAGAPTALAVSGDDLLVWSGSQTAVITQ